MVKRHLLRDTSQFSLGEDVEQHENPDFIIWKKSDKLLMSWIFSTLTPSVLGQVINSKSSFEVWSKIERTYSQRSMARIIQLKQQLQSLKKGADSISEFVIKLKAVSDALASAEENVSERDMIMSLLNGVGHEYDSVVTLVSSQQRTMPFEDAQFLFLMHEQRIEQLNISAPSAHYVTNTSNFNNFNNSNLNNKANNRNSSNNNYRGGGRGRNR
ncbi:hypothetical protein Dsin_008867 [Dipteronia sinensis]|uniref:Retrovirus-related Pol polyprotein from transposon TNT 1-94 n=1 Tax=Dipteronia sinensis TaxID=43782 RepID=A0AAE0EBJ7_9ROSI|nr:hypothetical protein Dsin_008867 [Dipteronia sinensis]